MNKISELEQLKESLYKSFTRITSKIEKCEDETRLLRLGDIQHKIAKALIDCETLLINLNPDAHNDDLNKDIVSFIEKVRREGEEKRALQVFKTWLESSEESEDSSQDS